MHAGSSQFNGTPVRILLASLVCILFKNNAPCVHRKKQNNEPRMSGKWAIAQYSATHTTHLEYLRLGTGAVRCRGDRFVRKISFLCFLGIISSG